MTVEPRELGDRAGAAGVQHGDEIAARRDRVGEESAARELLLQAQVRALDREDRHRVAAGIRRDEVRAVVREHESVLAREGVGRRARARGAETTGGVATGVRDGAVARLAVAEHAIARAGVGFDEERAARSVLAEEAWCRRARGGGYRRRRVRAPARPRSPHEVDCVIS